MRVLNTRTFKINF